MFINLNNINIPSVGGEFKPMEEALPGAEMH